MANTLKNSPHTPNGVVFFQIIIITLKYSSVTRSFRTTNTARIKIYSLLRYCTCTSTCHINHSSVRRPHDDNHVLQITWAVVFHYLLPLPLLLPSSKEIKINPFYFLVFVCSRLSALSVLKLRYFHLSFLYRIQIKCGLFPSSALRKQSCVRKEREAYTWPFATNLWNFRVLVHMLWRLLITV